MSASSKCIHWWKTVNQIKLCNPAATAAGSLKGLFTSPVCIFPFLCYHLLLLFFWAAFVFVLAEVKWLSASLPKHRWHSGRLQEKANEVPCRSKTWLLIWPLQEGTAKKEKDHRTCRQLLTSEHATVGWWYTSPCGSHFFCCGLYC